MKKRLLALSLAAGFTALMTACGDETTNTDILKANSFASDSLPTCDASYSGMLANDTSKNAIFACTKVGASYEWVNVLKNTQAAEDNSGCTAKELEDKSGVNVVCMGKTIATLKNGQKGEDGAPGTEGEDGDKGPVGDDASGYSNGKDLTLDSTDCKIVDAGVKAFVFYKCGDFTYAEDMDGFQANIKTWNGLNGSVKLYDQEGIEIPSTSVKAVYQAASDPTKSEGKLVRWENDEANWSDGLMTAATLDANFAISGTATLTVQEDSLVSSGILYMEPYIGVVATLGSSKSLLEWGGVCLTYKSEKPIELVIANSFGNNVRATIKSSAKETTVNIAPNAFEMDYLTVAGAVEPKDVVSSASFLAIKVVGGIEKGTYTNTFSIFEFGAYGRCGGPTYAKVNEAVREKKGKTGSISDKKDKITYKYKTITIGNQVWMAENLRSPYVVKDADDNDVYLSNCPENSAELTAKGCLYTWSAAMDSAGKYLMDTEVANECGYNKTCTVTKPVRGICPDGWHLPSPAEVDTLYKNAGYNSDYILTKNIAGKALSGKAEGGNWLGFNATQTGITKDGDFNTIEKESYFYAWTSTETSATLAPVMAVYPTSDKELIWTIYPNDNVEKYLGVPVRCVQDQK